MGQAGSVRGCPAQGRCSGPREWVIIPAYPKPFFEFGLAVPVAIREATMGKKNRRRTISDNPAQPTPARDFQSLLNTALSHLKSGKVVEAEEAYKEILRLLEDALGTDSGSASMKESSDPPAPKAAYTRDHEIIQIFSEVHNNLGVALQFQGKTDEAAEHYQRTIDLNPENIDALNNMGVLMQGLGRWRDAADYFRRTISLDSNHPDAHANLGAALMSMGDFEEAISVSRRALKINPRKEVALNTLGNAQKNLGLFDEAIENYEKALELNPGNIDALGNLGAIFLSKGNLDSALASFRRVLDLNPRNANAENNLGVVFYEQGDMEAALAAFGRSLEIEPNHTDAHSNRGNALKACGRGEEAEAAYRRAVEIDPGLLDAHANLGVLLQERGSLDEALAAYRRALDINPNHVDALTNISVALKGRGETAAAAESIRRVLEINPRNANAENILGGIFFEQGELDSALAAYDRALAIEPAHVDALANLGAVLTDLGRGEEAEVSLRRAIELDPGHGNAHVNLGTLMKQRGELASAIACYRRSLEINPRRSDALNNLGLALYEQGESEESVSCLRRAVESEPESSNAHNSLGMVLAGLGRRSEGVASFLRAVEVDPDCVDAHFNHSMVLLVEGDFNRGWEGHEWRLKKETLLGEQARFPQKAWDGSSLDGKTILIHAEQGYGDTVQFVRYAREIAAPGTRIVLECQPRLTKLLGCIPEIDSVIGKGEALPRFDEHVFLLSLPRILGTRLDTIPGEVPYIRPPADWEVPGNLHLDNEGLKVGLVWAGNPGHANDRNRSIALEKLAPCLETEGARFFSLQFGEKSGDIAGLGGQALIEDLSPHLSGFSAPAAAIAHLDLVLSVDTVSAHIAGAMGKPVWMLLPFVPDWRWLLDREDSPWYPTMRLFRQSKIGDWEGVVERVKEEIALFAPE
jgi:tetratricopeptide (TPR) repeat protein